MKPKVKDETITVAHGALEEFDPALPPEFFEYTMKGPLPPSRTQNVSDAFRRLASRKMGRLAERKD